MILERKKWFFVASDVDFPYDRQDMIDTAMTDARGEDGEVEDENNRCQSMESFHHTYHQIQSNLQVYKNTKFPNYEKCKTKA